MSTGYCDYPEIFRAVSIFKETQNDKLILLHCSANYPTEDTQVNLDFIPTLSRMFNVLVGFSDHTLGIHMPIAAVAKGAVVIEKHLTLSRDLDGPDHHFAIEPVEFKAMVKAIRSIEKAQGNQAKIALTDFERTFREQIDMKVCLKSSLKKGEAITKQHLEYKRSKTSNMISSWDVKQIVGLNVNCDLDKGTFLKWEFLDV